MNFDRKKVLIGYLKEAREASGLTQKELGRKMGISRETVNAIENLEPNAVNGLKMTTVSLWWTLCLPYVPEALKGAFAKFIKQVFRIN